MIRPETPADQSEVVRMRQALWPDSSPEEVDELLSSRVEGDREVLV